MSFHNLSTFVLQSIVIKICVYYSVEKPLSRVSGSLIWIHDSNLIPREGIYLSIYPSCWCDRVTSIDQTWKSSERISQHPSHLITCGSCREYWCWKCWAFVKCVWNLGRKPLSDDNEWPWANNIWVQIEMLSSWHLNIVKWKKEEILVGSVGINHDPSSLPFVPELENPDFEISGPGNRPISKDFAI